DFVKVIDQISEEEISFLPKAIEKNIQAAEIGLRETSGMQLGKTLQKLVHEGLLEDTFLNRLKYTIAAASDARMSGKKVPITGCGGSGNHGITFFITVGMAYKNFAMQPHRTLAKSLALGLLVLVAIKSQTGVLTPMCGCAVAAASAAAASITYAMGGNESQIAASIQLVLGNLIGMICDGAKFGCSLKTSTSGPIAVEAALLALKNVILSKEGVIGESFQETLGNLAPLHKMGMKHVDATIVDIMLTRQAASKT
ncbi:MAG: L-serine ammonia-lyase, iron-sulfur-dependent, subunit alpha, partial [Chlamydiota bacterium]